MTWLRAHEAWFWYMIAAGLLTLAGCAAWWLIGHAASRHRLAAVDTSGGVGPPAPAPPEFHHDTAVLVIDPEPADEAEEWEAFTQAHPDEAAAQLTAEWRDDGPRATDLFADDYWDDALARHHAEMDDIWAGWQRELWEARQQQSEVGQALDAGVWADPWWTRKAAA
jgi:hypothetical protein